MEITFQVSGVRAASGMLKQVVDLLRSTKPMQGMVDDAKAKILEKTAAGRSYRNIPFKQYSKGYAKKKGTSRPDLKVSGTMLGAIESKVISAHHGVVDVSDAAEPGGKVSASMLAAYHNQGTTKTEKHGGLPKREFMGLTVKETDELKKKHWDDPIYKIVSTASLRGEHQTD